MTQRLLLLAVAVTALLLVALGLREDPSRPLVQNHPMSSTSAIRAVDSDASAANEDTSVLTATSNELVATENGDVIRTWGSFVRAKDIAVNCVEAYGRTRCESRTIFDHPYSEFSDEQLSQIYETDAVAAYLYAHRLLIQSSEGKYRRLEEGFNVAIVAVIRSGEQQAFDLILHEDVLIGGISLDPTTRSIDYSALEDRMLWLFVGDQLNLLSATHSAELRSRSEQLSPHVDITAIRGHAEEISNLFRQQKLIVVGDTFTDET